MNVVSLCLLNAVVTGEGPRGGLGGKGRELQALICRDQKKFHRMRIHVDLSVKQKQILLLPQALRSSKTDDYGPKLRRLSLITCDSLPNDPALQ